MRIEARDLTKRYGRQFVVRDFSHVFSSGSRTSVSGPNGSGKSTLIRMLCGQLMPSSGVIGFGESRTNVAAAEVDYRLTSLCAPYVELIEELTGDEILSLHGRLRGFRQNLSSAHLWDRLNWNKRTRRQPVSTYSSGMRQRVRLLLALATDSQVVFLDEPTSNLDVEGVLWYRQLVNDWIGDRTLVIASNEERDFVDCTSSITAWC